MSSRIERATRAAKSGTKKAGDKLAGAIERAVGCRVIKARAKETKTVLKKAGVAAAIAGAFAGASVILGAVQKRRGRSAKEVGE